ncbi:hypothetical protein [Methylobacterium symbioticum]|uniref:Uncharacterized protein n=1 Tax=Methylobacterium symbioticum TaxID=2584084 RepID=A0A509EM66_9HYPH|nr:hypothetical protein [Methylobacterium symbioticum]VUD74589.1 hypothetical protein MET9862_05221 [Methylobacterium symbioticum]
MAVIHEHSIIWADTDSGVWTARAYVCGVPSIFYAAEMSVLGKGDVSHKVWQAHQELRDQSEKPVRPMSLGGRDCVLVIAAG